MGTFSEDSTIKVSELINMWVAEGFLKPISGKSLEESGEEYLMDLIDRNLILVVARGYFEKVVFCNIHDLVRDLCIRVAQKEKFVFSTNQHNLEGISRRRIVIDPKISKKEYRVALQSASAARSVICNFKGTLPFVEFRLLRVLKKTGEEKRNMVDYFKQVNLRCIVVNHPRHIPIFSTSVSLLWNLQTLIILIWFNDVVAPPEFWKMPLLRHVECPTLTLPDPPSGDMEEFVLHNLHTLSRIVNLKIGEEIVKRIPNVKKLALWYQDASDYCLNNLGHLYKLECLDFTFSRRLNILQYLILPYSLKELCLWQIRFSWEDVNTKIGSLPHLQSLELSFVSVTTSEWETIEEQFCSLKYLRIAHCMGWEYWSAESSHFPCLEHLILHDLRRLKEIPCCIGDIPSLESVQLGHCRYSAIISAKQIVDEQEELGNENLQVIVTLNKSQLEKGDYEGVESLKSRNFQVKILDSDI